MPISPGHILICRTDNIGDVVLTLPLAGFLKSRFPGVKIDFLCRDYAAPVVAGCRHVDRVITLETLGDPVSFFAGLGIDTIIFAYPDKRLAKAARQARVENRVGTSHRLFHWWTCNRLVHFSRVKSGLHEAQLNFRLLRPLGIEIVPQLADIPALYGLAAGRDEDAEKLCSGDSFKLILHPKSNGNGREWPILHYAELVRLLGLHRGIECWITGSAREGEWLQQNASAMLAEPNVVNLCGRFDLHGLCALIGGANGLIASGTGPLHIAAALGQRTLGLFPPLKPIDPARWAPLGERAQVLCRPGDCASCKDPSACPCMNDITPQQVVEVVLQWRASS